jgi:hypothetical protein
MMHEVKERPPKQPWKAPELTVYGSVESITQQKVKLKKWGPGDDFCEQICSA